MNAAELAKMAYGAQRAPVRTPRSTEYEAFARITHRIKAAYMKGKLGFPDLVKALDDNRKLWTLLTVDLADDENGLPEELRAQLIGLAGFTFQHTTKVLQKQADPVVLIEINAAIMTGLRQRAGAAA